MYSILLDAADKTRNTVTDDKSKADNNEKSTSNREPKNTRPDGRRKTKEKLATRHIRDKKLKLAESTLKLQEFKLAEILRRNEILLFTNGPGWSNSTRACEYFDLKHKEVCIQMEKNIAARDAENTSNLDVLSNVAGTDDK